MSTVRDPSPDRRLAAERGRSVPRGMPRPRLGILATHPIQYQAPLYQALARRGAVDVEVAFLSMVGAQPYTDLGFGVTVAWDVDLLGGYRWITLDRMTAGGAPGALRVAAGWLRRQDIVVLHGHARPSMLAAGAACRALRVPYLLRGESHAEPASTGWRRLPRHRLASFMVRGAAGALPIGRRNAGFYERYGNLPMYPAPYSVDDERFRAAAEAGRPERIGRLASLGLDPRQPTVIFSGKLTPRKRPLDVVAAVERCAGALNLVVLGDGPLRPEIERRTGHLPVRCLGFVNQAELPGWYASGDVLALPSESEPWGVVVNEGMACGLLPVVSDAVGCGPDLVDGLGEIVPVGDVQALARALSRAATNAVSRGEAIRRRLERYTIAETALGYEHAALATAR